MLGYKRWEALAYIALYREWRPRNFDEVVGQEHITRTLKNALVQNRTAHAYLFCGPRGTGKTSVAKVLAKAVNCEKGPTPVPCDQCTSCRQIAGGNSLDVMEIDAASNRGIDEIRDLREKIKYAPSESRYKVYIIDEVHMLTTEAFNALLKTLEEPPNHAIFILATTEPHKIPLTILSRCQRFDFHRLSADEIVGRLVEVSRKMGLEVEEAAFQIIARKSEGALRDALSILDQCISYAGEEITSSQVLTVLGVAGYEAYSQLVDSLLTGDVPGALVLVDQLVREGKDLGQLTRGITGYLRDLLVVKTCSEPEDFLETGPEGLEKLKTQAELCSVSMLIRAVKVLSETEAEIRRSSQPRFLLEVALVGMAESFSQEGEKASARALDGLPAIPGKALPSRPREGSGEAKRTRTGTAGDHVHDQPAPAPQDRPDSTREFGAIKGQWTQILEAVNQMNRLTKAFLVEAVPVGLEGDRLILSFQHDFHRQKLQEEKHQAVVREAVKGVVGMTVSLRCLLHKDTGIKPVEESPVPDPPSRAAPPGEDLVREVLEVFGGKLIEKED